MIVVAVENEVIGMVAVADALKPEAEKTVVALKAMGMKVRLFAASHQRPVSRPITGQCRDASKAKVALNQINSTAGLDGHGRRVSHSTCHRVEGWHRRRRLPRHCRP